MAKRRHKAGFVVKSTSAGMHHGGKRMKKASKKASRKRSRKY